MEQKKTSLTLIYALAVFSIGVAIKALSSYFSGFGIPFVASLILTMLVVTNVINKDSRKRFYDILVMLTISIIMLTITYCVYDWAKTRTCSLYDFTSFICNFNSVLSLIFLVYTAIRFVMEKNDKKFILTEILLGNKTFEHKKKSEKVAKQPKELKNGEVENKPRNIVSNNDKTENKNEVESSEIETNDKTLNNENLEDGTQQAEEDTTDNTTF